MIPALISSKIPFPPINPNFQKPRIYCFHQRNHKESLKERKTNKTHLPNSLFINPDEEKHHVRNKSEKTLFLGRKNGSLQMGNQEMMVLCGLGYYVNGFRGFPWLALNFHMAYNLNMHPSTLQLVQNSANLPMVAKPLYGILSDALYIGGAHRIPYISIGVSFAALVLLGALKVGIKMILSWGSLALIPLATEALPSLMACVLFSNLGASIAEVAKDALLAEYSHYNKLPSGLQSYATMASAIGGALGNLLGGFFLLKPQRTKPMFLAFASMLILQLTVALRTQEESLGLPRPSDHAKRSIFEIIKTQYSDLIDAVRDGAISRPLIWAVSSVLAVPMLSGSLFCYQTNCLNLDPWIIGMSKVTGQLMLLSLAVIYDRFGKDVPMRKMAIITQIVYASSLLLDLVLVKQINTQLGIPNEVFTLCFSGLAETIAQFKLLPFYVLFAGLAPPGCKGSLMSFLASALCLSSILSGFLGIGLGSVLGITSGDYSGLPLGILVQFSAALLPLLWVSYVPMSRLLHEKPGKTGKSKRTRRNRRVGRVMFDSMYSYRRERESDFQR